MSDTYPTALDAERAVLGAILLNREAIVPIAGWLQPDDFFEVSHSRIYAAAQALYSAKTPPDLRTIADLLKQRGQLADVGGIAALADLSSATPTSYHVEYYARSLQRAAGLRRLIAVGQQIAFAATRAGDAHLSDVLATAQAALDTVSQRHGSSADTFVSLSSAIDTLMAGFESGDEPVSIPTGLTDLDAATGGLWPGELIVPAARPGHGKSALLGTIAANVAKRGYTVALISYEMNVQSVAIRTFAAESGINGRVLRRRRLDDVELVKAFDAAGRLTWPLFFAQQRLTLPELRAQLLDFRHRHGALDLVLIDYLQIVPVARSSGNRARDVDEVAQGLKYLALELNVPIIAPAQINREIDKRATRVPTLADLREAGGIEQAADVVYFITRDELYDPAAPRNQAHITIAKQRSDALAELDLYFDPERTTFRDLDKWRSIDGY